MDQSPLPSFAEEICTSRSRLLCRSSGGRCLHARVSSRAPEGASVHGGAVSVLKERRARPREEAHACPHPRAPPRSRKRLARGPVVSEGRPSARRGPGLEIQGPQCAFETSMFMCPAVHMSTRNLLRSSSTHEPSDPPFRVVSIFVCINIGLVRSTFRDGRGRLARDR